MKKLYLLLLPFLAVLSLSTTVFATNTSVFYVKNAYFKGNGAYDVVVHDASRDTLKLYVDGKNPVKAKVNKQGWATFQKVKLSGQSKLSFTKHLRFLKYDPIYYVKYISVNKAQVQLSDTGKNHTYGEFYTWLTTPFDIQSNMTLGQSGFGNDRNNYQLITDVCQYTDSNFGPQWTACMQKRYKDYLKPDTFVNDNWMGDYTTMVGDMNYAGPKNAQYNKATQEAQSIYERLAVTN